MKNSLSLFMYQFQPEVFIELYCVNKDRPEMNCNGSCHLAKMQNEETDNKLSQVLKQLQQEVQFCSFPTTIHFEVLQVGTSAKTPLVYWVSHYHFSWFIELVKPPSLSIS